MPGVYVLLSDPADLASVLKIGPARSLRRMFERECAPAEPGRADAPRAMMYCESLANAEEADRLLQEYRRKHGRRPALNSPY